MRRVLAAVVAVVVAAWGGTTDADGPEPIKVLVIAKDRDHPPETHEYLDECRMLARCLGQSPGVEAVVSDGWPRDPAVLEGVDCVLMYTAMGGDVLHDPVNRPAVEALLDEGVGLVMIHWSTGASDGEPGAWLLERLGGWFGFSFSKFPVFTSVVEPVDASHPICRGWAPFEMNDEFYTGLKYAEGARPLLRVTQDGQPHTVGWTFERGGPKGGRSFGYVGGHFHRCFEVEAFRRMVVNATLWAAGREVPEGGAPVAATAEDLRLSPDPRRGG
jgi:hypothetical protein